jgi:hypothetical protein
MIRNPRSDQSALALGSGRASPARAAAEFAMIATESDLRRQRETERKIAARKEEIRNCHRDCNSCNFRGINISLILSVSALMLGMLCASASNALGDDWMKKEHLERHRESEITSSDFLTILKPDNIDWSQARVSQVPFRSRILGTKCIGTRCFPVNPDDAP